MVSNEKTDFFLLFILKSQKVWKHSWKSQSSHFLSVTQSFHLHKPPLENIQIQFITLLAFLRLGWALAAAGSLWRGSTSRSGLASWSGRRRMALATGLHTATAGCRSRRCWCLWRLGRHRSAGRRTRRGLRHVEWRREAAVGTGAQQASRWVLVFRQFDKLPL
jgi:hypothetical protein